MRFSTNVSTGRRAGFPAVVLFIVLAGAALLTASCDLILGGESDGGFLPIPESGDFFSINFTKAAEGTSEYWYTLSANRMYLGEHCAVFVDDTLPLSADIAESIGAEFDANVYQKIRENFAAEADVDRNGKIIILVLDIPDDYDNVSYPSYYAGYFYGLHMLDDVHSNRADMIFMDADPGLIDNDGNFSWSPEYSEDFRMTLAHEFQHLVNFSEKVIRQGNLYGQDTWINEGLSAGAEYLYLAPAQNQWKIDYYNGDNSYNNLKIMAGENFLTWSGELDNYATVYLFFQWLQIQASNGTGIYKDILSSAYNDYRAVSSAAASRMYSGEWKDYLRDWFLANALNLPAGKYGYKGIITTTPLVHPTAGAGDIINLAPGEGFYYAKTTDEYSPAGTVIEYAAFDSAGNIDLAAPFTYERLLAFNTVGVVGTGPSPTSPLPPAASLVVSPVSSSTAAVKSKSLAPPRTRFPIDAVFGPDAASRGPLPRSPGR